jgi:hypothetical protein
LQEIRSDFQTYRNSEEKTNFFKKLYPQTLDRFKEKTCYKKLIAKSSFESLGRAPGQRALRLFIICDKGPCSCIMAVLDFLQHIGKPK